MDPLVKHLGQSLDGLGVSRDARLLVALSTGLDSVALLHLLHALPHPWSLTLSAVHVNHGLRPEGRREEAFARTLCASLGVPLTIARLKPSPAPGESLEMWARRTRWDRLERAFSPKRHDCLVLAHHADDILETALLRLLDGAGPGAVAGLRPLRGHVLRPLAHTRKAALEAWLRVHGHPWCEDPSNQNLDHRRNHLRLHVLPLLETAAPARSLTPMLRSLTLLREDMEALESLICLAHAEAAAPDAFNLAAIHPKYPEPIARRALAWWLTRQGLRPTQSQLNQIFRLYRQRLSPTPTGQRRIGFLGPGDWRLTHQGILVKNFTKTSKKAPKK